jgi:hypothetical protein
MAVREWLWRYGPAEAAATAGAVGAAIAVGPWAPAAVIAYAGAIGEGLGFYAVILVRELRRCPGPRRRTVAGLLVEFGPAEIADTVAVRPLAMYLGPLLIGHLAAGVLAGKLAADLVFYVLAIAGYELRKAVVARRNRPAVPAAESGRRLRRRATKRPRSLAGADSTVV